jgi:hypothetical protein
MYSKNGAQLGLPHSSHSVTARGTLGSATLSSTSTKPTHDSTAQNSSGRVLSVTPISRPPAEAPMPARRPRATQPFSSSASAHAT